MSGLDDSDGMRRRIPTTIAARTTRILRALLDKNMAAFQEVTALIQFQRRTSKRARRRPNHPMSNQHHRQKMAQQQRPRTLAKAATPTTQQHSQNDHTANPLLQVALYSQKTAPMLPIPRYTALVVNGQGGVYRSGHGIALANQAFLVRNRAVSQRQLAMRAKVSQSKATKIIHGQVHSNGLTADAARPGFDQCECGQDWGRRFSGDVATTERPSLYDSR
jgi:hypothetical protein